MRTLTRSERRRRDRWVREINAKLARTAIVHNQSGEIFHRVEDICDTLGMTESEYLSALRMTGFLDTILLMDLRDFTRRH